jgi:hypothetical protein
MFERLPTSVHRPHASVTSPGDRAALPRRRRRQGRVREHRRVRPNCAAAARAARRARDRAGRDRRRRHRLHRRRLQRPTTRERFDRDRSTVCQGGLRRRARCAAGRAGGDPRRHRGVDADARRARASTRPSSQARSAMGWARLGLEVHEAPRMSTESTDTLAPATSSPSSRASTSRAAAGSGSRTTSSSRTAASTTHGFRKDLITVG